MSKHLERLHEIPCVVCSHLLSKESWKIHAHHLESVRDEISDYGAVSLCEFHHEELHHLSRRGFENKHKLTPIDLLALTIRALEKSGRLR